MHGGGSSDMSSLITLMRNYEPRCEEAKQSIRLFIKYIRAQASIYYCEPTQQLSKSKPERIPLEWLKASKQQKIRIPMKHMRAIRLRQNVTVKGLAEKINMKWGTLYSYDTGNVNPDLETAEKIAKALGCTVDELSGTVKEV
jgi:DNA-binding XRE family transcriptional regulator